MNLVGLFKPLPLGRPICSPSPHCVPLTRAWEVLCPRLLVLEAKRMQLNSNQHSSQFVQTLLPYQLLNQLLIFQATHSSPRSPGPNSLPFHMGQDLAIQADDKHF